MGGGAVTGGWGDAIETASGFETEDRSGIDRWTGNGRSASEGQTAEALL
jgi:hypothetical protein